MFTAFASYADQALYNGLRLVLESNPIVSESRNGPVLRTRMPLTTVYTDPKSRVLFDATRDCNPFLHLFESMWMLQGRRDLAFVEYFTPQMRSYSDDGTTLNGAYGYRWRHHFGLDQIEYIISELKDPNSRRAHMGMWDARNDPKSAQTGTKDVPCNLSIAFDVIENRLNMTVFNRSNDLIWGAYGANLVHMSFLQEYVAQAGGFMIGNYYQVSNNAHIYLDNPVTKRMVVPVTDSRYMHPDPSWRGEDKPDQGLMLTAFGFNVDTYMQTAKPGLESLPKIPQGLTFTPFLFDYTAEGKEQFDADLNSIFFRFDYSQRIDKITYVSRFGKEVLSPMGEAYSMYKDNRLEEAVAFLENQQRYDWIVNGKQWIERRIAARKAKETKQ